MSTNTPSNTDYFQKIQIFDRQVEQLRDQLNRQLQSQIVYGKELCFLRCFL